MSQTPYAFVSGKNPTYYDDPNWRPLESSSPVGRRRILDLSWDSHGHTTPAFFFSTLGFIMLELAYPDFHAWCWVFGSPPIRSVPFYFSFDLQLV